MWKKIYRGGVQRTTPETREVNAPASGELLPGTVQSLTPGAKTMTAVKGVPAGQFFYFTGEALYGDVDDNLVATPATSVRLYSPRSGDLFVGRAVASVALVDDLPLTVDANGRLKAAVIGTDPVHCYVDMPAKEFPQQTTPTVLDQRIPVKIK